MSNDYLAFVYKQKVHYYSKKLLRAQVELKHYIQLEMFQLQAGIVDVEVSNKIINLDNQIIHYEIEIKRNSAHRDWLSRFKEINKEKNLRFSPNVSSGVQSDVFKSPEHSLHEHTGVSINWGKVFQLIPKSSNNNGTPTVTNPKAEGRNYQNH